MLRSVTKLFNRSAKPASRRARLGLESLEERTLLATTPVTYAVVKEWLTDFGGTLTSARVAPLAPVMETNVQGKLSTSSDVDMFRVQLEQGQIFTAQADATTSAGTAIKLDISLLDGAGAAKATNKTGPGAANGSLVWRVESGGTYYVKLFRTVVKATSSSTAYTLHLRPMGLNNGSLDPSWLQRSEDDMYGWLKGDVLQISGPVGHGFGIRGNWQQTTTTLRSGVSSTYRATGTIYLQSAGGEVPMTIPAGGTLTLVTRSQIAGEMFGEVSQLNWIADLDVPNLAAKFGTGGSFGFDMIETTLEGVLSGPVPHQVLGIALGSDPVIASTGAPLNSAVPYVYFTLDPLNGAGAGGFVQVFSIIADPADPFLYVESGLAGAPIPGSPVSLNAIGYSRRGLIPYTPINAPSQWQDDLTGHFYLDATIDLTAATGLPLQIDGDITLDLDPANTGALLGGVSITSEELAELLHDPAHSTLAQDTLNQVFSNLSVGVNGTLKAAPLDSLFKKWFKDKWAEDKAPMFLTLGTGSLIYHGPTHSGYFRGSTPKLFEDTPLELITVQSTIDIDAAFKPGGSVYVHAVGEYSLGGFPMRGEILFVNNYSVPRSVAQAITGQQYVTPFVTVTGAHTELSVNVLGAELGVKGRFQANGDFELKGFAEAHFGSLDGSFNLTVGYAQASGFRVTADLHAGVKTDVIKAGLDATLRLSYYSGRVHYAGSGSASVKVKTPWGWDNVGSVSVSVGSDKLKFKAAGITVKIPIPG